MRKFSRSRNTLRAVLISIQMFSTAVFTIWFLYVWAQNSRFGSLPDCNHVVKYVLFFASVPATATWLRAFFIVGTVFAACYQLFEIGTLILSLKTKCSSTSDEEVDVTGGESISLWAPSVGCVSPIGSPFHILNFIH